MDPRTRLDLDVHAAWSRGTGVSMATAHGGSHEWLFFFVFVLACGPTSATSGSEASTGSASGGSSEISSGDSADPGCGNGIVEAGELCYRAVESPVFATRFGDFDGDGITDAPRGGGGGLPTQLSFGQADGTFGPPRLEISLARFVQIEDVRAE
jgi:hypothetical protein